MMNPLQNYQQNAVNTASPGELTLMLYNGCLKFIHLAKLAINESRIQEKNTNLIKAQNIIQELMLTLKMEQEVSKQLMPIYDYLHRQLIQANIKNDVSILDEVEGFIVQFRDTWKEVIQLNRQKTYQQSDRI